MPSSVSLCASPRQPTSSLGIQGQDQTDLYIRPLDLDALQSPRRIVSRSHESMQAPKNFRSSGALSHRSYGSKQMTSIQSFMHTSTTAVPAIPIFAEPHLDRKIDQMYRDSRYPPQIRMLLKKKTRWSPQAHVVAVPPLGVIRTHPRKLLRRVATSL